MIRIIAPSDERGSGSILAVAIIAALLAAVALVLPLSMVLAAKQAAAGAADAAALAAADAAVGILPGAPCELAELVAAANGARVSACDVDGVVVTVLATVDAVGFEVPAAATAGPPSSGTN